MLRWEMGNRSGKYKRNHDGDVTSQIRLTEDKMLYHQEKKKKKNSSSNNQKKRHSTNHKV